ncbi:MAG: hypothetical protein LBD84_01525 [Campylobacteraceae bacterium]|jgi:hypothetical protein|nr:hypothetical protein [Campylobacteraceae bacterium]
MFAKSLNKIIKKTNYTIWEDNKNGIVRKYNETLNKCKNSKDEAAYYTCMRTSDYDHLGSLFEFFIKFQAE